MNYQKTQEVMEKLLENMNTNGKGKAKFNKTPEQLKEEKWIEQVTNPRTGTYFQWSDLKGIGIEPFDEETGKHVYPIKTVNSITRVQTPDGREWLMTRQTWTGLDRQGNEESKSMDDKEIWIKPIPKYEMRPTNPGDRFSKMERQLTGIVTEVKQYDKPFNAKDIDDLNALPSGSAGTKSLVTMKVDANGERVGHPYGIPIYEDFKSRPFDELYEYASTPSTWRYKDG